MIIILLIFVETNDIHKNVISLKVVDLKVSYWKWDMFLSGIVLNTILEIENNVHLMKSNDKQIKRSETNGMIF